MFFSEEKNQKTFESAPAEACRPWPDDREAAEKVRVFWFCSSDKELFLARAAASQDAKIFSTAALAYVASWWRIIYNSFRI
jgi:hypothetical protein